MSQKPANGKVSRLKLPFLPSDVYACFVQMATLSARDHPAECALVLPLVLELPKPRGDDAGAGGGGRPLDDQSLGVEVGCVAKTYYSGYCMSKLQFGSLSESSKIRK